MNRPIISLTSDFGVQSQGIGNMEGVILGIAPEAHIIHLMHGLPDFDIRAGARTMETTQYLPVGFHVCVVDPGVGSNRKAIIIQAKRGDYLIGPDNGVLIPAINFLEGFVKAVQITNPKLMIQPVSPIFHGRHIFAPAAAYLANGVSIWDEFNIKLGDEVILEVKTQQVELPFVEIFSQVKSSLPLILKDDYGRVEVAINLGNFAKKYKVNVGDRCVIKKR